MEVEPYDVDDNTTEPLNKVKIMVDQTHADVTGTWAILLCFLFGFLMLMVLMNQLIALMADSYNHVMENLAVETLRARAEVIIDVKFTYGESFLYRLRHKNLLKTLCRNPCKKNYDTSDESLLTSVTRELKLEKQVRLKLFFQKLRNVVHCASYK